MKKRLSLYCFNPKINSIKHNFNDSSLIIINLSPLIKLCSSSAPNRLFEVEDELILTISPTRRLLESFFSTWFDS